MQKERLLTNTQGFSLVELLVAVSVFLVFVTSTTGAFATLSRNIRHAGNTERATMLAEEALEAGRNLRDAGTSFLYLPDGTRGLVTAGNIWNLTGSSDTNGIFTRTVMVSTVSGSQKRVSATVSWADQVSQTNTVTIGTYLTDWHALLNIGLTVTKTVVNHGGTKTPSDFLPVNLSTFTWDNSVDPPVLAPISIPIVFSPSTMTLGPNTYTFLTTNDPNYGLTLSTDCAGNTITLASGDAKLCTITYEQYVAPTVVTPTVTSIGTTTATLGATVSSLGYPATISARGTCWGTTPAPTTNCVPEGTTTAGAFTHARTGFTPNTLYYYRGYATNATGTGYSPDGTFTTSVPGIVPTLSTPTATAITSTTATLGARVTSLGTPASISARGICYGTSPAPTTNCVPEGGTTTGVFSDARTGFTPNTLYYYRGYATNATGTGYSSDGTFTPASTITFVGVRGANGTTASIPTHAVGDLLVAFAYRDGSNTAPTVPSGWTTIASTGGTNSNSSALAYRIATGADSGAGWANATGVLVQVYRGQATSPIGANATASGSGTTVTYPGLTLTVPNGASWVIGFAGHRNTNTNIENPPPGMVQRVDLVGTAEIVGDDTNGGVSSWIARNVIVFGTPSGWMGRTLEIKSK